MSYMWQFCSSSENKLKRCVEAAAARNEQNKWSLQFNKKTINRIDNILETNKEENKTYNNVGNTLLPTSNTETDRSELKVSEETNTQDYLSPNIIVEEPLDIGPLKNICDIIDSEPLSNIDLMVNECLKNIYLFKLLAQRLSVSSVEKISSRIFTDRVDNRFIANFYIIFVPAYLKREYNLFSLDLFVKASKSYLQDFEKLLCILFRDTEISNQILHNYIMTLNVKEKTELANYIIRFDLSKKSFMHHIVSLYLLYKDCMKTEKLQKYVFNLLNSYSFDCKTDRNYGRLLLSYIQSQSNNLYNRDLSLLEKLVERHQSQFKRPCSNILKELKVKLEDSCQ